MMNRIGKISAVVVAVGCISGGTLLTCKYVGRTTIEVRKTEWKRDKLETVLQEFHDLQERFNDVSDEKISIFKNSIDHTVKCLEDFQYMLYSDITRGNVLMGLDLRTYYTNNEFWDRLEQALLNYGYREQGNPFGEIFFQLAADDFFLDSFPQDDISLITGESYGGFFVKSNNDLLIPGATFYSDVLDGKIDIEKFSTTPYYFKSRLVLANSLIKNGEYQKAIEELDTTLGTLNVPEEVEARIHNAIGHSYVFLLDAARAMTCFNKAIEIDPNWALPYMNRGNAYEYLGLNNLALEDYHLALELEWKNTYKETEIGTMILMSENSLIETLQQRIESLKQRMQ